MSYVTRQLAALPFGHIIGSPLKAAVEAQGMAAQTTVEFIEAVGFRKSDTDDSLFVDESKDADAGDIRNVVFKYAKTNEDGTSTEVALQVPILTIVPIPYIRVAEMTIDFTANMKEAYSSSNGSSSQRDFDVQASGRYGWGLLRLGFKASYSSRHSSTTESNSRTSTESTMNVNVRAVQDDLPGGLSKVLGILEASISESSSSNNLPEAESEPTSSTTEPATEESSTSTTESSTSSDSTAEDTTSSSDTATEDPANDTTV